MMTCLKIACRGRTCRMVFIREVSSISTAKVVLPTTWTLPAKFASLRQGRQASATPRVLSRSTGMGRDRLAVLAIVPSDVDRADAHRELRTGHLSQYLRQPPASRQVCRSRHQGTIAAMAACPIQPPSSRFSGSIQASALDESLVSPTSSSIPSYASGCTASRIRGRPCFRP